MFSLFLTGQVRQAPKEMLLKSEDPVTLSCSHNISNYYMILWYEKLKGDTSLNLIGHVLYKSVSVESQYTNQFTISGDGEDNSKLHFKPNATGRTIVYFCAASKAQC